MLLAFGTTMPNLPDWAGSNPPAAGSTPGFQPTMAPLLGGEQEDSRRCRGCVITKCLVTGNLEPSWLAGNSGRDVEHGARGYASPLKRIVVELRRRNGNDQRLWRPHSVVKSRNPCASIRNPKRAG